MMKEARHLRKVQLLNPMMTNQGQLRFPDPTLLAPTGTSGWCNGNAAEIHGPLVSVSLTRSLSFKKHASVSRLSLL